MNKLNKIERKNLKKTTDEFLQLIKDRISTILIFGDVDALDRLVTQMEILSSYELLKALKNEGMQKEIDELCVKAGKKETEK